MEEAQHLPGWPDRYEPSNRLRFRRSVTRRDAAWWHERFAAPHGLFPLEMAERLTASAPGDTAFTYDYVDWATQSFSLSAEGLDRGGRIWFHNPVLELERAQFLLDRIEVDPSRRRKRISKGLLGDLYRTARLLGIRTIALSAEDSGGYVWARAGFVPDPGAWRVIAEFATRRLARIERLAHGRMEEVRAYLNAGFRDPTVLHAIARMKGLVSNPAPSDPMDPDMVPLGVALLLGVEWNGRIDLEDELARERLEQWLST